MRSTPELVGGKGFPNPCSCARNLLPYQGPSCFCHIRGLLRLDYQPYADLLPTTGSFTGSPLETSKTQRARELKRVAPNPARL